MQAGGDELDAEQAHLDLAHHHLERMRKRTLELIDNAPTDDLDLQFALKRRASQLVDTGRALCFGRIDSVAGETWHIGRRHVEDEDADPVVVEWRAPIAVPFYRARVSDPLGLARRRQFVVDGRTLLSMADDLFGDGSDEEVHGPQVRGRDALLAELERGRTGQMLDIVATIQAEQDEVIRAPLPGVLVVQGGPGTGKTAIGLHRAAFLLFGDDELARAGVLVVGPNRTFLRYIAQVLPSLGEEAVVQTTLADLVPDVRVRATDTIEAQRVKGDVRMAGVLFRALTARRQPSRGDLELRHRATRLRVATTELDAIVASIAARRQPYNVGRTAVREALVRGLYDRYAEVVGRLEAGDLTSFSRAVTADRGFRTTLATLWPAVSPVAIVRDLLGSAPRLAECADGILDAAEQRAIIRRRGSRASDEPWTEADGPLVDEVTELLEGRIRAYGHVVVDEAQDLSPMQVRMLARRCPTGSATILGDLAQGTGVWARDHWTDLLTDLPAPDGSRVEELRLGYRSPGRVLELASRLLPEIAPQLRPTESIRPGRTAPRIIRVSAADLAAASANEAAALATEHGAIAVIVPTAMVEEADAALHALRVDSGEASRDGLDHAITVVPAPAARGLEFDAVVVVEPAAIVADAARGLRLVYIALTRPTQHLSVVHALDLPGALDQPS